MKTLVNNFDPVNDYILCKNETQKISTEGKYIDKFNEGDNRFYVLKSKVEGIENDTIVYIKDNTKLITIHLAEGVFYLIHKNSLLGIIVNDLSIKDLEMAGFIRVKKNVSKYKGIIFKYKTFPDILISLQNNNIVEVLKIDTGKILYRDICQNVSSIKLLLVTYNTIEE